MSNRIRILFHCALEGSTAHVGHKALKAMEIFVSASRPQVAEKDLKYEWVDERDWQKRKRPRFINRHVEHGLWGPYYKYYVARDRPLKTGEFQIPSFKNVVDRARWLWENLPGEIRQQSSLCVTRESRRACWRRSRANPTKYGWQKPSKLKAPATVFVGLGGPEAHWSVDPEFPEYAQTSSGTVPTVHPAASPAPTTGSAATKPAGSTGFSWHVEYLSALQASAASSLKAPGPTASKPDTSGQVLFKSRPKKKPSPYAELLKKQVKASLEIEPLVVEDDEDKPTKAVAEKPKLKIGVWA